MGRFCPAAALDKPFLQRFYLVVDRDSEDYQQHFEATALASLLRTCYSLLVAED